MVLTNDRALSSVLAMSIAMVMGPTPPGTGVIAPAIGTASSYATSPTSAVPDFFVSSAHTPAARRPHLPHTHARSPREH